MEKLFCTFEQTKKLKKLGFDLPCFGFYNEFDSNKVIGSCYPCEGLNSASLKTQALGWIRENHNLFGMVYPDFSWNITGGIADSYGNPYDWDSDKFNSYDEAENNLLDNLIKIIFDNYLFLHKE